MQSFCLNHFPQIRYRNGERLLWNPLVKKTFKNLPEERVRLQTLEFLIRDAGWPASRISCETGVKTVKSDSTVRADIICYDRNFKPYVVIECKAPSIRLTDKTAVQIAGYNRTINAPYLWITNGIKDLFYRIDSKQNAPLPTDSKNVFTIAGPPVSDRSYYTDRYFIGKQSSPQVTNWLAKALPEFLNPQKNEDILYLDAGRSPAGEQLNHYYRIFTFSEKNKIAVTFLSSEDESTNMIAILNEDGVNTSLLETRLEQMLNNSPSAATIYQAHGKLNPELDDLINFNTFDRKQLVRLPEYLYQLLISDHHITI